MDVVGKEKLCIIAGNRFLPILLAQRVKEKNKNLEVVAICFKGETSRNICKVVDKTYWIKVGNLRDLKDILSKENLRKCVMVGQVNPLKIFKRKVWDDELTSLVESIKDFRPHTIFGKIIEYLEKEGTTFIDSTLCLQDDMADIGIMNDLDLDETLVKDINFGVKIVSSFVDLDVGQTVAVKSRSTVALESLEGTNSTILRAYRLAGRGCTVLKFSKKKQDLRFDVPVVGISTLKILKAIKANSLVLEKNKVIILQKTKFLSLAKMWGIPIVGKEKNCSKSNE